MTAKKKEMWLTALTDPLAQTTSNSSCICLSDFNNDGDTALLISDEKSTMRIWRGGQIIAPVLKLLEIPKAIFSFFAEKIEPVTPWIGLLCGTTIFFYKAVSGILRPKAKFDLPAFNIDPEEQKVWDQMKDGSLSLEDCQGHFEELRENGVFLTPHAHSFINSEDDESMGKYQQEIKSKNIVWRPSATCVATMHDAVDHETDISHVIIGTESRELLILAPSSAKLLLLLQLPAVPALLAVEGEYTVEYRIVIGFRNGSIGICRDGKFTANVITTATGLVGMAVLNKRIYVLRMDKTFQCYSVKGKCLFSLDLPSFATSFYPMILTKAKQFKGCLVGLDNGDVLVFNGKSIVSTIKVPEVCGIKFGIYGREEGALITTSHAGTLKIQLLHRTANLEPANSSTSVPAEQDVPIQIPKRSPLFFEQQQEEIQKAPVMYQTFQNDLARLRLETTRSFVHLLSAGGGNQSSQGGSISTVVQLSADIQGLGPFFNVVLTISCVAKQPLMEVFMNCIYNPLVHKLIKPIRLLPCLLPGQSLTEVIPIKNIHAEGISDVLKICICAKKRTTPLIVTNCRIPACEIFEEEDG